MTTSSEKRIRSLFDRFIQSEYFRGWLYAHLGNDLFISDPDRADRIYEAASEGCDGSTHYEHINDMRLAWRDWQHDHEHKTGREHDRVFNAIEKYLDGVEAYHEKQGTLHQEVG